ncbi:MurT ligase domain-containing protein [Collinsella sp. AGMB00827]|uniref:MurT ligase domain-containing protein n=1 Tax=Collinsella ureilytica TaxID=2869515 RepID=A0ABS7MJS3_9ACTN|nr:MurT ligase domain-containing protein [Collinsella urealyticum]MBY4797622.1 MurT ligase domain-containing protein [Collinsella urealyticum]
MASERPRSHSLRFHLALIASKVTASALRMLGRTGEQLPGAIAGAIDPQFLAHIGKPEHCVIVSGTNGKTTTTNLLCDLLAFNKIDVITNRSGANCVGGFESIFLKHANLSGHARRKLAVMELDELSFRTVMPHMDPEMVIVTNLYGDTFTRSADPAYVFSVMDAHLPASSKLVLNGDDLLSCRLGAQRSSDRVFFSIARLPEDTGEPQGIVSDMTVCPECGGSLEYEYCHLRHLGKVHCTHCGLTNPLPDYEIVSVDRERQTFVVAEHKDREPRTYEYRYGSYSVATLYNVLAVISAAREMGLAPDQIARALDGGVTITERRLFEREAHGKRVACVAAKGENATANSVAYDIVRKGAGNKAVVIVIHDSHMAEVPEDTEFTGWYYQADFEYLADPSIKQVINLGTTSEDVALRLALAGVDRSITHIASSPEEVVEVVDFDLVDTVYIAHCVTNVEVAHQMTDQLIAKVEGAFHE